MVRIRFLVIREMQRRAANMLTYMIILYDHLIGADSSSKKTGLPGLSQSVLNV